MAKWASELLSVLGLQDQLVESAKEQQGSISNMIKQATQG
jgi:hypothetical protein